VLSGGLDVEGEASKILPGERMNARDEIEEVNLHMTRGPGRHLSLTHTLTCTRALAPAGANCEKSAWNSTVWTGRMTILASSFKTSQTGAFANKHCRRHCGHVQEPHTSTELHEETALEAMHIRIMAAEKVVKAKRRAAMFKQAMDNAQIGLALASSSHAHS